MKKISLMLLAAAMAVSVCSCAGTNGKEGKDTSDTKELPEIHAIAYDESMDTLNDEGGADAFDHKLDHADSRYYKFSDYYNMESDETLHILPHFETYQQTTMACGGKDPAGKLVILICSLLSLLSRNHLS